MYGKEVRDPYPAKSQYEPVTPLVMGLWLLIDLAAIPFLKAATLDSPTILDCLQYLWHIMSNTVSNLLQAEYGVDTTLEPLSYTVARWVKGGWEALQGVGRLFNTSVMKDVYGRPVLLFRNDFARQQVRTLCGEVWLCMPPEGFVEPLLWPSVLVGSEE